jgi:2-polyprenyl-3-methyl-5-hydroxy-6-metoxy-1,4-benzoquinol methylase
MQNKAEKFWDRAAGSYDREEKKDEKIYLQIADRIKANVKSTHRLLDFGCGTGRIANEIAGYVQTIDAIDISSNMIKQARKKAEAQNISNVEYSQTTVFDKKLPTGYFDVITAFYILHLAEDTQAVIQRIFELLKPGGLLLSATPCMAEKPFLNLLYSVLGRVGIIPKISSFTRYELEQLLANERFIIAENTKLIETSNQYFMVAKK